MFNYEGFCACTSLCNYNIKVYFFPLSVSSRDAFNSLWFIKGCFGQMALVFFISTREVAVNFAKVFRNYLNFTYNNSSCSIVKSEGFSHMLKSLFIKGFFVTSYFSLHFELQIKSPAKYYSFSYICNFKK